MSFNTLSKTSLGLNDQPAPELPDNIARLQKSTGPERTNPDYPKHVNYPDGTYRVVNNQEQEDAALKLGPPVKMPSTMSTPDPLLPALSPFRPTPSEPPAVVPVVEVPAGSKGGSA